MAAQRSDKILTIELLPGTGDLRLDDFLEELEAFKVALRETERLLSGHDPSLYFRIKRLQKQSPAVIELEAVSAADDDRSRPSFASHIVRNLTSNLRVIGTGHRPRKIDVGTLSAYEGLTKPLEKHGLEVVVRSSRDSVKINREFREAIQSVMGEDESSYGSISGRIEGMTTHSRNTFRLYPVVGPLRIIGFFTARNRNKFAAGMDKYVTVWGKIKYKTWAKFPYEVLADDIEIHDGTYPSLLDLRGIAPDATGTLSTQEFLDEVRDE